MASAPDWRSEGGVVGGEGMGKHGVTRRLTMCRHSEFFALFAIRAATSITYKSVAQRSNYTTTKIVRQ
eukprot:375706-Prorocentrum_minimum.AAC.1